MINDIKVAATISAGTVSTGVGTWFDLIPSDIGKLAALVGVILSTVLIVVHLRNSRIHHKKIELEIAIMEQKERDRLAKRCGDNFEEHF